MIIRVYQFHVEIGITNGKVVDSWGTCDGIPITDLIDPQQSIDYSDFEAIALRKYREDMADYAEAQADMRLER